MLRWIDELNGIESANDMAMDIKSQIKSLKSLPASQKVRSEIKSLYNQLDELQFQKDYMFLVIDKKSDYMRAVKGFKINGTPYKRLLGTNGGIKNSTIVFVSESKVDELRRRIENDRDQSKELVTAKLEAYKALTCSASIPVPNPKGVIIIDDCYTKFKSDVVYITDENDGEPETKLIKDYEIEMDASDGFGLITPALADRWSEALHLNYRASGFNTRFSFEKGMVVVFDPVDFAEKIAGSYIIKDAWGTERDVRDAELILTTSMVKLWDSYNSCEDYIEKSYSNGYTFSVSKTSPRKLENERSLNYQFIQSYDLSDEDIASLCRQTATEIRDVLSGDWRKTVLFLKGSGLNENNVDRLGNDFVKGMMIDSRVFDDPFVKKHIYTLIKKRINDAKIGVLKVHANYSIVCGDPFALMQSAFGLEVTGLLKAGEIYNKYWIDNEAEELACFRAPMTNHSNIRKVRPSKSEDAAYWYQYITTCTVFNAWDTATAALNG